jgi:hypothetical protein
MSEFQSSYGTPDVQLYQEPERTSIMAIMSMVFGILGCCLVGLTSILAIPLSVFAMIGISRSKGRVGGMGFAIVGLVMGLLTLALWLGLIIGGGGAWYGMMKNFADSIETTLIEAKNGNYDAVRATLAPPASEVTDEELDAFLAYSEADFGSYVSSFDSLGEMFTGYVSLGEQINSAGGGGGMIPVPMQFDSGWVIVIYEIDPSGQGPMGPSGLPMAERLIFVGANGSMHSIPPSDRDTQPSVGSSDAGSDEDSETPSGETAEEGGETEPVEPEEGP